MTIDPGIQPNLDQLGARISGCKIPVNLYFVESTPP